MSRRQVHPIERESYRRMRALVDVSGLPPRSRAVTERVIHASADLDYAHDLVLDEEALEAGVRALADARPVVVDVTMVAAGVTAVQTVCGLHHPDVPALATREGITRSAAGMRIAARDVGDGAVWVVGNAPTALFEILRSAPAPALVIGLPVGFVDAVESKQALRDSGLPAVSNRSRKGGSGVAAAALNALLYAERVP